VVVCIGSVFLVGHKASVSNNYSVLLTYEVVADRLISVFKTTGLAHLGCSVLVMNSMFRARLPISQPDCMLFT